MLESRVIVFLKVAVAGLRWDVGVFQQRGDLLHLSWEFLNQALHLNQIHLRLAGLRGTQ